jgi:hypothetical protein
MVALKQLKSQQVSLQAFAPDVSSETAYVINRMMAKHPDERYQSYEELIGHLTYAREKLIERSRKPLQPKQRVVMETEETRKFSAVLSLILLGVLLLAGIGVYVMRDKIFPAAATVDKVPQQMNHEEAGALLVSGVSTLAQGDYEGARTEFARLTSQADFPQPEKSWAVMNGALANLLLGDSKTAVESMKALSAAGLYSTTQEEQKLANFFVEVSRVLSKNQPISASIRTLYDARSEAFALLLFGIWDWENQSAFEDSGLLLKTFLVRVAQNDWASQYKPLAEKYLADWKVLEPLETGLGKADTPAAASALLKDVTAARSKIQTGNKINDRLDAIEKALKSKGATP